IQAVVNIIGFDVDDAGQQALQKVAEAGGGEYETVESEQDLRSYFDEQHLDLSLEWMHWHTDQSLDVTSQFYNKLEKLKKLSGFAGELDNQIEREWGRMTDAIEYLDSQEKFGNDEKSDAWDLVDNRKEVLSEYRETRDNEMAGSLESNERTLQDKIDEKAEEMREKYE
ncbi:hypothetical protein ACFQ49_07090, partial [Kroppenstedtia eburnea]